MAAGGVCLIMHVRLRLQLAEVLGPDNRWYCSQARGRAVDDPEELLIYFIRSGGAADFAHRFVQAMGPLNRWYCSEHFGREIRDPEILWNYYMRQVRALTGRAPEGSATAGLSLAC